MEDKKKILKIFIFFNFKNLCKMHAFVMYFVFVLTDDVLMSIFAPFAPFMCVFLKLNRFIACLLRRSFLLVWTKCERGKQLLSP